MYANCRSLAELRQVEWLHTDLTGHFGLFLSELFARERLPPPARVTRCTSQALFYSLSMMADVVIYWSKLALTSRVLSQQFHTLDFGVELPHLKLNLMLREDGLMTRSGEYFINCVREIVAEDIRRLKQS